MNESYKVLFLGKNELRDAARSGAAPQIFCLAGSPMAGSSQPHPLFLSIYLYIYLFIYLFIICYLFIYYLSICYLSIYLHLFIFIFYLPQHYHMPEYFFPPFN